MQGLERAYSGVRRVSFVAPNCARLFRPGAGPAFGGAEVRTQRFAAGLAARGGFDISVVVDNDDGLEHPPEIRDGITLFIESAGSVARGSIRPFAPTLFRRVATRIRVHVLPPAMLPFDERRFPTWTLTNADTYCVFGVGELAAQVARFCKLHRRRFVLFLSSDLDVSVGYRPHSMARNAYGSRAAYCHFAITSADLIVAQTKFQSMALDRIFGLRSTVVPNPIDLGDEPTFEIAPQYVLWIGKTDNIKQPGIALRLARERPDIAFLMILNDTNPDLFASTIRDKPANVIIRESFDPTQIDKLYGSAIALLNTSAFEGFPNTFIEAGRFGVPVLSLNADPEGMLGKHGCGIVANGDLRSLADALRTTCSDRAKRIAMGRAARDYVRVRHGSTACVERLARELASLPGAGPV